MNTVTKGEVMANMKEVVCRTEEVLGKPVTHVSVRMKNGFTLHAGQLKGSGRRPR